MSLNINEWIEELSLKVKDVFKERVEFIGIQGSYRRNEATENSDIDAVVILDKLSIEDLKKYKKIAKTMENNEKMCGFISGKAELENWPKSELFQFYHDTRSIYGSLDDIIPTIENKDIIDGIKAGASMVYHHACHSYLYSDDKVANISAAYKNTFFILQSVYYIENKKYISSRSDLFENLENIDKEILNFSNNNSLIEDNINESYKKIIDWSSDLITRKW